MSSRITSNMLATNYLRNMNLNLANMKTLQNQLASGKEIQKASDDPYTASRSMQLNTEMSYNTQYNANIKDTSNWLDTTDTALSQIGTVLGRVQTLLVNAGNGTYSDSERSSIQDEVKSSVNELSQILNTNFDGSYIFGGTKTGSKPTTVDSNGKLQYADKDGNPMTAYTKADGTITSSATTANTAYTLTAADIAALTSEASTSTDATRISEINGLISAGVGSSAYKKADGTITASATTANTAVSLNMTDVTALQNELSTAVDPRKTEITGLLNEAIPLTQINSDLKVDISEGVTTDYNKTATDILEFKDKNGNAINVSDLLSNIIDNLGSSDPTKINQLTGQNLTDIQSVTSNLLQKRSEVGTMQNRMDSAQTNNENANQNMTDILSKTEDIDITEKTMEYSTMQTTYTAALQVSAKILPMSILTYL